MCGSCGGSLWKTRISRNRLRRNSRCKIFWTSPRTTFYQPDLTSNCSSNHRITRYSMSKVNSIQITKMFDMELLKFIATQTCIISSYDNVFKSKLLDCTRVVEINGHISYPLSSKHLLYYASQGWWTWPDFIFHNLYKWDFVSGKV